MPESVQQRPGGGAVPGGDGGAPAPAGRVDESGRRQVIAGGYRLTTHPSAEEQVTLVGVGAILPEVLPAAELLTAQGVTAGVVCLTSPDLVFRSAKGRGSDIAAVLFPTTTRRRLSRSWTATRTRWHSCPAFGAAAHATSA